MEKFKNILYKIFDLLALTIDVRNIFIVYSLKPWSFNSRKFPDIVIKLKKENEDLKNLIEDCKKKIMIQRKKWRS